MREHIGSTYSTRKNLVLRTYYVWYGPVEVYMRVLRGWHGPVEEKRSCIRKLKQYALACVRGTGQLKLYVLVECALWTFASISVYVEVRLHDCAALMMKDHPQHGHSFNFSPITGLNRPTIDIFYQVQGISFLLLGCVDFLERSIPQARRAGATYHCVVASDS